MGAITTGWPVRRFHEGIDRRLKGLGVQERGGSRDQKQHNSRSRFKCCRGLRYGDDLLRGDGVDFGESKFQCSTGDGGNN